MSIDDPNDIDWDELLDSASGFGTDVYIIGQDTVESKLLARLGFDRKCLPVAKWRGRRRSLGGYGKRPVAWRISGQEDVERLCTGLKRILSQKPASERTPQEKKVLARAARTLAAFRNRERRALAKATIAERYEPILTAFLAYQLPVAQENDVTEVVIASIKESVRSVDELLSVANKVLSGRPAAWKQARVDFVRAMMSEASQQSPNSKQL